MELSSPSREVSGDRLLIVAVMPFLEFWLTGLWNSMNDRLSLKQVIVAF